MLILGVKVDNISKLQALERVESWLDRPGKHYITTPNLEFIKDAKKDPEFKKILNNADLAVPDSSHLGWLKKLAEGGELIHFDVVPGVDLMDGLCKMASEKAYTIGLLGGVVGVAEKAAECLKKNYPKLQVVYSEGGVVDGDRGLTSKEVRPRDIPSLDILFVALGHRKQEKWISENLERIPVKVAMGVGGAFDYISGTVPRAPIWMRSLGMEWFFRLLVQPWRIKRQLSLVIFLTSLLFSTKEAK